MDNEQLTIEEISFLFSAHIDTQIKIYDCLITLIATQAGSEIAKELQELHEQGKYLYPPPYTQTPPETDPQ